eukprot:Colp12_sorted_trinity150504_noHs@26546
METNQQHQQQLGAMQQDAAAGPTATSSGKRKRTASDPNSSVNSPSESNEQYDFEDFSSGDEDGDQPGFGKEKRAHHNALERKRRDVIKNSYTQLRDAVPEIEKDDKASRAKILESAADYIISTQEQIDRQKVWL